VCDEMEVLAAVLMWPWSTPPTNVLNIGRFGFVDTSIYSRFRLMRMLLQTKRGKGRPLVPVCIRTGTLLPVPESVAERVAMFERCFEIIPRHEIMCYCRPLHLFPFPGQGERYIGGASSTRGLRERSLQATDQTHVIRAPRYWDKREKLLADILGNTKKEDAQQQQRLYGRKRTMAGRTGELQAKRACSRVPGASADSMKRALLVLPIVVYDENMHPIQASELKGTEGVRVHCPLCDTEEGKRSTGHMEYSSFKSYEGPDGNPCAKTFRTRLDETMLWCFSCQSCFMIMDCAQNGAGFCRESSDDVVTIVYDSENMKHFPVEVLIESGLPRLRAWNAFKSDGGGGGGCGGGSGGDSNHRDSPVPHFICVNAGMGSGKTQAAATFSKHPEVTGTVVVCYRRALLRDLASRFDIPYYLDTERQEQWVDQGSVAICLNSLPMLRTYHRALVVIDEAGFVRRSFVGETFRSVEHRRLCFLALGRLLSTSAVVLLLQHGLSDSDVDFYLDAERLYGARASAIYETPTQAPSTQKYFFKLPAPEQKYQLTTHIRIWLLALRGAIVAGTKTFIPCSQRRTAEALALFVIKCCIPSTYKENEEGWRQKVALVTGHSKSMLPHGHFRSSEDYVAKYKSYDVAITTCALETGVSLTGHYTSVFAMYRTFPVPHAAQVQLANRVRNSNISIIYAEKGNRGALASDLKHIRKIFNLSCIDQDDLIIAGTLSQVTAEYADTYNRNDLIWRYRENSVPFSHHALHALKAALAEDEHQVVTVDVVEEGEAAVDVVEKKMVVDLVKEEMAAGNVVEEDAVAELVEEEHRKEEKYEDEPHGQQKLEEDLKEVARQYWGFAKMHEKGVQRYVVCPETDEALEQLIKDGEDPREVLTHLSVSGALHSRMGMKETLTCPVFEAMTLLDRIEAAEKAEEGWRVPSNANRIAIIKMFMMKVDHLAQALCGEGGGDSSDSTWSRLMRMVPRMHSMTPLVLRTRENVAWVQLGLFLAENVFGCVLPSTRDMQFYAVSDEELGAITQCLRARYSSPGVTDINVSKHVQKICGKEPSIIARRVLAREIRKWTPFQVLCRFRQRGKMKEHGFCVQRLHDSTALIICASPERTMCMMESVCTWKFFEAEIAALRGRLEQLQLICIDAQDSKAQRPPQAARSAQDVEKLVRSRVPEAIEGFMGKVESLARYLNKR
jgi:hypothetical protein